MSLETSSTPRISLEAKLDICLKAFQKTLEGTDAEAIVKTAMAYKKAREALSPQKEPSPPLKKKEPLEGFAFPLSFPLKPRPPKRVLESSLEEPPYQIGLLEQTLYTLQVLILSLIALGILSTLCKEATPPHK